MTMHGYNFGQILVLDGMARALPAVFRDTDKRVFFGESMFQTGVVSGRDSAVGGLCLNK